MSENNAEKNGERVSLPRTWKLKPVKTLKITGVASRKLGCFHEQLVQQMFIVDVLKNIPNEQYLRFFAEYANSQKEISEFKAKLEFCELTV